MNRIFLLADVHGNWKNIRDFNIRLIHKLDESDVIIILGDFGANFFLNERDDQFKSKLAKFKCQYFVIRGNHEERPEKLAFMNAVWYSDIMYGNQVLVEEKYPYIKYAADFPSIYNIDGYKTLIIPGAYSVDKYHRLQMGWPWFGEEQLTENEMDYGRFLVNKFDHKFDLVLSHTCPIIYEPADLFLSAIDQSMVDKTMERYLGELEYGMDYRLWCWGHFHEHRVYPQVENRQPLMLYNDKAIELHEWMEALPNSIGKTY